MTITGTAITNLPPHRQVVPAPWYGRAYANLPAFLRSCIENTLLSWPVAVTWVVVLGLFALVLRPAVVCAEDDAEITFPADPIDGTDGDKRRATLSKHGISLRLPEGWRFTDSAPGGLVTIVPEKAGTTTRIELRVSPRVPTNLREVWTAAFLESLGQGFDTSKAPTTVVYSQVEGQEFLLESRSDPSSRLAGFIFFREETAYVMLLYGRSAHWEGLYATFLGLNHSVRWR